SSTSCEVFGRVVTFKEECEELEVPLESEELEVLEQPEQFLEQLMVDHQYDYHT
ncbi:hypothetical protein Tco_0440796, partial [Tanacetum coccineum]